MNKQNSNKTKRTNEENEQLINRNTRLKKVNNYKTLVFIVDVIVLITLMTDNLNKWKCIVIDKGMDLDPLR